MATDAPSLLDCIDDVDEFGMRYLRLMVSRSCSTSAADLPILFGRHHSWSSSQIIGPADTPNYGDIPTAWASRTPDIQEEWIIVEFPKTVSATQVDIYETFNPGAVTQIYSVSMLGGESLIWEGKDPLAASLPTRQTAISKIQFDSPVHTRRIKIVIDSRAFPGWNEIDAVELIDQNGKRQWASAAWTSSSFGKNISKPYWFLP